MSPPDADRANPTTHDFGVDQVGAHVDALHRDLAAGRTSDFTDTDWWILQWATA